MPIHASTKGGLVRSAFVPATSPGARCASARQFEELRDRRAVGSCLFFPRPDDLNVSDVRGHVRAREPSGMARGLDAWCAVFTALIVGDDPITQRTVRDALAEIGCFHTDMPSLDAAVGAKPDLIVVDLAFVSIADLERIAVRGELPILALCDEAQLVLVSGATECALKPVRRSELVPQIRRALRKRAEDQLVTEREHKKSDQLVALQREKSDLERPICARS